MQSPFLQASGLLRVFGLFFSGLCHQLPEHSISIAGVTLPLCARCTGTYLGASLVLLNLYLRKRCRADQLPPVRILALLGMFVVSWAVDSVNSYVRFATGGTLLYAPNNALRLMTGLANGLALSFVVFPMFNFTLWREPSDARVITNLRETVPLLLQALALAALIWANNSFLLWPLVLLSLVGVLLLLTLVNSTIVIILLHRESRAQSWKQALLPLGVGLALSLMEVGSITSLRYVIASGLARPTL